MKHSFLVLLSMEEISKRTDSLKETKKNTLQRMLSKTNSKIMCCCKNIVPQPSFDPGDDMWTQELLFNSLSNTTYLLDSPASPFRWYSTSIFNTFVLLKNDYLWVNVGEILKTVDTFRSNIWFKWDGIARSRVATAKVSTNIENARERQQRSINVCGVLNILRRGLRQKKVSNFPLFAWFHFYWLVVRTFLCVMSKLYSESWLEVIPFWKSSFFVYTLARFNIINRPIELSRSK